MNLVCVEPSRVVAVWPLVSHLIKSAIDKTRLSDFGIIERDVLNADALLWIVWNNDGVQAAAVTQIGGIYGDKYCTIVACAGHDRKEWLPFIRSIEVYAKQEMCRAVRIFGRPGWKRALPDYKVIGYVLERTL